MAGLRGVHGCARPIRWGAMWGATRWRQLRFPAVIAPPARAPPLPHSSSPTQPALRRIPSSHVPTARRDGTRRHGPPPPPPTLLPSSSSTTAADRVPPSPLCLNSATTLDSRHGLSPRPSHSPASLCGNGDGIAWAAAKELRVAPARHPWGQPCLRHPRHVNVHDGIPCQHEWLCNTRLDLGETRTSCRDLCATLWVNGSAWHSSTSSKTDYAFYSGSIY
jgi:hypothetical protein